METLTAERFMKTGIMALLVLMLAGCALAAPVTLTEQRITTDLADQVDPAISGTIIVYTDYRSGEMDVWYYDLDKNQEFMVTGAPGDQALADVSDGTIVYTDIPQGNIMLYDGATGTLQDITADTGSVAMDPSVGGGIVAWQDYRDGHAEIYGKNLGTGEVRRLSTTPPEDSNSRPASSGSIIVWQRCYATGTCDIYAFDWSTGIKTQVTETPDADERNPDISGTRIVYEALRGGEKDICLNSLVTGEDGSPGTGGETCLSLPGQQVNPSIWGDNVAFEDISAGGLYHVNLWNIPSGSVFGITGGSNSQYLNEIWENRIVYTDDRAGQLDIYLTGFTFNPPVAGFTAVPPGGPAPLTVVFGDTSSNEPNAWSWSFGDGGTSSAPNPFHEYTAPGTFTVSLTVTNAGGSDTTTQDITVTGPQVPPVAEIDGGIAGYEITLGTPLTLQGSSSYDPDGTIVSYIWDFRDGSPAEPGEVVTHTWTAAGTYNVELTVTDNDGLASSDTITVVVTAPPNAPPVADPGTSQSLTLGQTATLDGSGSSDPDGDPLTYHWSLTAVPAGSTASIVDPAAPLTTFTPDLAGTYTVQLIVSDGLLESDPGTVQVQVVAGEETIIAGIRDLEKTITAFPPGVFKNANMQKTLINKLDAVIAAISAGDYADALDKLRHDILPKTDGCAVSGAPDRNDWITDCTAQDTLSPLIQSIIHALEAV